MEERVNNAIKALCDEVKSLADAHRNIRMQEFINSPQMVELRRAAGLDEYQ